MGVNPDVFPKFPDSNEKGLDPQMREAISRILNQFGVSDVPQKTDLTHALDMKPPPPEALKKILKDCLNTLDDYSNFCSEDPPNYPEDIQIWEVQKRNFLTTFWGYAQELSGYLQTH